jgi:hypothetical protein
MLYVHIAWKKQTIYNTSFSCAFMYMYHIYLDTCTYAFVQDFLFENIYVHLYMYVQVYKRMLYSFLLFNAYVFEHSLLHRNARYFIRTHIRECMHVCTLGVRMSSHSIFVGLERFVLLNCSRAARRYAAAGRQ